MPQSLFIEGPAGVGKTTYAVSYIRDLLQQGIPPENILVLVPHPALGQPYRDAFLTPDWPSGAQIPVMTLGSLTQRAIEIFWPVIAEPAGFAHPKREPTFLNLETAQYYMQRFAQESIDLGLFDGVNIKPGRIISQTLDNLLKASANDFTLDEVEARLITAWGDRHSSRPLVYHASLDLARRFRDHCKQHNLLDYSLQSVLFSQYLLPDPRYRNYLGQHYHYLIADNLEEHIPIAHDFVSALWNSLEVALLLFDTQASFRIFLGADPTQMHSLKTLCDSTQSWNNAVGIPPVMEALAHEFDHLIDPALAAPPPSDLNLRDAFEYNSQRFYPQMVAWVIEQISSLIDHGVPPREIVVLAPFLGDSLRFTLMTQLEARGIPAVSHRPSRALRDEPAARAILTLMALCHPDWNIHPPAADVSDALQQAIEGLDPVRAWLLTQIVYRRELASFEAIRPETQARITFTVGQKYDHLREWISLYQSESAGTIPPDHFLSRLFGEVLSQPGYGFHTNLDAGRIVSELVESARRFRRTLYPDGLDDWSPASYDYYSLVQAGLLAALYTASWRDEEKDAVFLAPAHTFLMRNRRVDYQFWLDIGSSFWWERLEQPLTHPYVLSRNYPHDQMWTDDLEYTTRRDTLRRLITGLTRRVNQKIYLAITNLGEQGYEQRGPLLQIIQRLIQRYETVSESE